MNHQSDNSKKPNTGARETLLNYDPTEISTQPAGLNGAPEPARTNATIERRQFLEHHLKGSPTDLESYMELAQLYRDENRPADARRVLQQAVQVFPDDGTVLWELEEAVLARSLQQYREVLEISKKVESPEMDRELDRSASDWACRRIEVCEARLERNPELHDLRLALGEALLDAGHHQNAIDAVTALLKEDTFSASASYLQGKCQLELGQNHDAMRSFRAVALRRAVPANPSLKRAALKLLALTAERIGAPRTFDLYQEHLEELESRTTPESQENKSI